MQQAAGDEVVQRGAGRGHRAPGERGGHLGVHPAGRGEHQQPQDPGGRARQRPVDQPEGADQLGRGGGRGESGDPRRHGRGAGGGSRRLLGGARGGRLRDGRLRDDRDRGVRGDRAQPGGRLGERHPGLGGEPGGDQPERGGVAAGLLHQGLGAARVIGDADVAERLRQQ